LHQGAAAVLEFYAIESPFAQPRNAFISQMFACLIGVGISKLFALNPHAEQYTAIGGALACGLTTAVMGLTGTVHPPAGATALLAVTNSQTAGLGWFLFPVMLLGITLMQITALIVNNIQRRYPVYWWTSRSLSPVKDIHVEQDHQKAGSNVPSHYEASLTDVPRRVVVERGEVWVPDGLYISEEERQVLRGISERI
jgi:CBS-domain-containing membrane protein